MKHPRPTIDTEEHDYWRTNLLLLRDPSLRAYAQDDNSGLVKGGGKNGGGAAILSSSLP
jgi:hypothetical protein